MPSTPLLALFVTTLNTQAPPLRTSMSRPWGASRSLLAAIEMAGTLSCESDGPGLGATFTIDLPMQAEATGIG